MDIFIFFSVFFDRLFLFFEGEWELDFLLGWVGVGDKVGDDSVGAIIYGDGSSDVGGPGGLTGGVVEDDERDVEGGYVFFFCNFFLAACFFFFY